MRILWDKKLIRLSDGSYIAWGLKRKKFFFANKNELKLNCAIIEYYEEREKCDKKVISDLNKMIAEFEKENAELKRQVEQKQHLADVRLEQSLESYKLFSDERKARIDVDIALEDTTDKLTYAKTIIQDLLDNTDEYARQRAEDFLKENK